MTPTILCVDDDPGMTGMLRDTLTPRGYHVLAAPSVAEAVNVLRHTRVDLIILDVMMPEQDGFALLEQLAVESPGRKIPVIMASGCGSLDARNRASTRGAVAYLQKPYQLQQLVKVIGWAAPAPEPAAEGRTA